MKFANVSTTTPRNLLPEASESGSKLADNRGLRSLLFNSENSPRGFTFESPFPTAMGKGRGWGKHKLGDPLCRPHMPNKHRSLKAS